MPFAFDQRNCPWPTYQGNMQRDGVLIPSYLVGVNDETELPAASIFDNAFRQIVANT